MDSVLIPFEFNPNEVPTLYNGILDAAYKDYFYDDILVLQMQLSQTGLKHYHREWMMTEMLFCRWTIPLRRRKLRD